MLKKTFKILSVLIIIILAGLAISSSHTKPTPVNADVVITDQNNDGIINLTDARIISPPTTTSCPVCVDVNGDKIVDNSDIDLVTSHFPPENPSSEVPPFYFVNPRFDVNGDNSISSLDSDIINNYLGQTVSTGAFNLDDPSELTFGFVANQVIVTYKSSTTESQKETVNVKYNLKQVTRHDFINAVSLESPQADIESLQKEIIKEPTVEFVEKNRVGEVASNDSYWDRQWNMEEIKIPQAWYSESIGSRYTKVAVIDTGIDLDHPDLVQNISPVRYNAFPVGSATDVDDDWGHGTMVSGIIGAEVNNVYGIAGTNFYVQIVPVKACAAPGFCRENDVIRALEWIYLRNDIKIVNMSICMGYNSGTGAGNAALNGLYNKNVNLIASAGNDSRNDACWPANHSKVISVGASTRTGSLASFSNRAFDVKAPGVEITSTARMQPGASSPVAEGQGTSYAAPHVTGVAALCRAVAPLNSQKRWDVNCTNTLQDPYDVIDSWRTIWYKKCSRFDFNGNRFIGIGDGQSLAFRINSPYLYDAKYDVFPAGRDGRLNESDIIQWFKISGLACPS